MSDPVDPAAQVVGELAELARAAGALVTPPEADQLCAGVVDAARRVFGAAACSIAVFDPEEDELVYRFASGAGASAITGTRMSISRGLAGWVAQSGQAIMVSDLGQDQRFARDIAESTSYVPTALMALPVQSDDTLLGVLSVLDRDTARTGAEHDLELGSVFAAQAAAALTVRAAFAEVDRLLAGTLARAATGNGGLAAALSVPGGNGRNRPELAEVTALLVRLRQAGAAEQRLALAILGDVLDFVGDGPRE
jgi:GAF domain-containing protein